MRNILLCLAAAAPDTSIGSETVIKDVLQDNARPRLALGQMIVELRSKLAHLNKF